MGFPAAEPEVHESAFADHSERFPEDVLRARGFKIEARPRAGEPWWSRDGVWLLERDARSIARAETVQINAARREKRHA